MTQDKKYNQRALGAFYEKKAGEYLEKCGYQILEYNFRCRMGEIDLIARDGEYLVFCEVKYRNGKGTGHAAEAVDQKKQKVITKCAEYYLVTHRFTGVPCRFDVVSMEGKQIELIKNAFEAIE